MSKPSQPINSLPTLLRPPRLSPGVNKCGLRLIRRMKNFLGLLCVVLAMATSAPAIIVQFNQLSINLTNSQEAAAKAEWHPKLNSNPDGLGFSAAAPET